MDMLPGMRRPAGCSGGRFERRRDHHRPIGVCGLRPTIPDLSSSSALYIDDSTWTSKAREAVGWVAYSQKLGNYDQTGVDIDFRVPYFDEEPWITVRRHFNVGMELAGITGAEVVLDLGAGRGWAAKQFALKGCRVAAIDVIPDEQIGLGRAWAVMEQAGVRFEPVIGDNENLPFYPSVFDLVFCAAVLHHTSNLPRLLENVFRVLKPGGRLVAVNEPCIRPRDDETKVLKQYAADELSFGINESRPDLVDYLDALRGAGFDSIDIFPIDAYGQTDAMVETWAWQLGAIPPPWRAWQLRHAPRLAFDMVERWRNRWAMRGRLPQPRSRREALLWAIMIHVMTGIVIFARRLK